MAALSVLVWLLSVGILVVGVVCLFVKRFLVGALMIGGSFLVWFISVGMLTSATPTARSGASTSSVAVTPTPTAVASAPPSARKTGPDTSKWERIGGQSAMDDSTIVSYTLEAEQPIPDWLGK